MSNSFANVNPQNMELTPGRWKYDGVDIGGTLGNSKIAWKIKKSEIKADQTGDTALDRRVSGYALTVETELAEIINKATWKILFPNADLIGPDGGGNYAIHWRVKIGASDIAAAKQLLFHPLSLPDNDLSGDQLFYLATASEESEITYGPDQQAKLKIVWNIYPDFSAGPACRLMHHGDPAIGLIAASAGSPSFTGTGNGTLTAVVVDDDFTQDETITVTCIGTNGAHKSAWKVVGSLSGNLGTVELTGGAGGTGNFSSGPIDFTITDGSTDFIVGDAFSIVTVAANYT